MGTRRAATRRRISRREKVFRLDYDGPGTVKASFEDVSLAVDAIETVINGLVAPTSG